MADLPALAVVLGAFASFAGFLFGYDTDASVHCDFRNITVRWKLHLVFGYKLNSIVTSILSVGTCIGALCGSFVGDALGRRMGIVFYIFLFAIGVALQTGCKSLAGFAIGRVFAGLGVGGTSCLVPVYQAECSPASIRGFVVSAYQFFVTVGLLIAAVVVNATQSRPNSSAFEIPIGVQFIWATIIVIGVIMLPESPRWLLLKGKEEKGRKSLSRLLGESEDSVVVYNHFAEIMANLEHERKSSNGGWLACFVQGEAKTRQRVLTGMALQTLQQLSGINFIMYYGTSFFQNSGISNAFMITIAINVVNAGSAPIGMWTADKIGRRPLMIAGAIGMGVAQLIVAITGTAIATDNEAGQKVLVAFVCIFIFCFSTTWANLAWVITSEIYPYEIRAKGMSLSTATQWLFNFGIGYATPYLVDSGAGNANLGSKVFFIWGGCCVVAVAFAYFCIPETKELSLEQIDLQFRNSTIIGSVAFRKEILAHEMHDDEIANFGGTAKPTRGAHVEDIKRETIVHTPETPALA